MHESITLSGFKITFPERFLNIPLRSLRKAFKNAEKTYFRESCWNHNMIVRMMKCRKDYCMATEHVVMQRSWFCKCGCSYSTKSPNMILKIDTWHNFKLPISIINPKPKLDKKR